jgi:transcriptional regulator
MQVGKITDQNIIRPEIESLLANGTTQRFIAQRYNTTEANLDNWLKKNGLKDTK